MRFSKLATLAVAVAMPVGVVAALGTAGVASAGAPPDTGTVSCPGTNTTATLTVPFVNGGTIAKKYATLLPSVSFAGCTGVGNAVTGGTSKATSIKSKGSKTVPVNNCATFASSPPAIGGFKLQITWSDGSKSKILMTGGAANLALPGFTVNGTVSSGSFAGKSVTINATVDAPTLAAITACIGGGHTPIPTLGLSTTIAIS